ncbi:MAG: hypothetical protein ACK5MP_05770, partial [Nostocoides sp.]
TAPNKPVPFSMPPSDLLRNNDRPTDTPELMALYNLRSCKLVREQTGYTYPADQSPWVWLDVPYWMMSKDIIILGKSEVVQAMDMRRTRLSDADAEVLSGMEQLACLLVDGSSLTDRGLAALAKLPVTA